MSNDKFNLPTETVELPSKGLLYPKDNNLAEGKVELKYMTAKEEDILTNTNFIKSGVVIDKLLKSLIVSDIKYEDLLTGDKSAIILASRILAYGNDYEFEYMGEPHTADLSKLNEKELAQDVLDADHTNEFSFTLPHTKNEITFKILTVADEMAIREEIKGFKKMDKNSNNEITTRLCKIITSINGSKERKDIREFVNNYFISRDTTAFRKEYDRIAPEVDLTVNFEMEDGTDEEAVLPIGVDFFWPEA